MESVGNIVMYFIIAIAIIVFSVLTVTSRRILRTATYLLFVLFATAGIYFQLGYEFLGAVQIAVYAGGIMVLFVFAILLTHKPGDKAEPLTSQKKALGLTAAVLGVAACSYALVSFAANACGSAADSLELDMARLGQMLMGTEKYQYLLPFEAISVLLLACIIGGIVVARKK